MKKTVLVALAMIVVLLLLPSCAGGVSEEEYDRVKADLAAAQAQLEAANKDRADVLAYAETIDVLLYPAWTDAGMTPRFSFDNEVEWFLDLNKRAGELKDQKVSNYIKALQNEDETAMYNLWDYCLGRIEQLSK
jgi:hypothetical protein